MPATEFSNEYQEPNTTQLTQWGNIIQSIIQADYTAADSIAQLIDYRVSHFHDTTSSPAKTYYFAITSLFAYLLMNILYMQFFNFLKNVYWLRENFLPGFSWVDIIICSTVGVPYKGSFRN